MTGETLLRSGAEGDLRRGLEQAGLGSNLGRADMEALGFYVCVADLEDELIRTHSGRKIRYARLLVDALELTSVPRPLDRLLAQL